ncbi:hypothetical protein EJV47_18085 [Hymenobacter gummosus]|uniref:Uncharacterized protein n=1 Tax=Hymenobacter gummosus TaxID=1776032 RepID=A0A431TZP7_9BACT|nr:hypothetical protein [Hymenobacter gummosus]RTQ47828.1 hypothetical protein EJV47_18085 [Hymenobacter gummosus]
MAFPRFLRPLTPRQLLALDGVGALVSAAGLGLLARFEAALGWPPAVLYGLLPVALSFAAYSLSCCWLVRTDARSCLRIIAGANLAYCVLTIGLLLHLWPRLTALGVLYAALEVPVILVLVRAEWRASRRG